jgi:WD40 repeat protein
MENFDAVKDTLLITSTASELHIRDGTNASLPLLGTLVIGNGYVLYVNFSPDNTKLVGVKSSHPHAVVWDLASLTEIAVLPLRANMIHACFSCHRETELVTCDCADITIWNYLEERIVRSISNARYDTFCCIIVDECKILSPCCNKDYPERVLKCWDYETGRESVCIKFECRVSQISQCPAKYNEIAVGFEGGKLALVDISTSTVSYEGRHHMRDITGIRYNLGGDRLFSCSHDGLVVVLDTSNGTVTKVVNFGEYLFDVALCLEETHVIVAAGNAVVVVCIDSGEKVMTLEDEDGSVLCWSNRSSVILM